MILNDVLLFSWCSISKNGDGVVNSNEGLLQPFSTLDDSGYLRMISYSQFNGQG